MNYNDINKALKQCAAGGSCRHCPLEDELGCRMKLLAFSLEIINRQKAEIERLEAECEKQYEQAEADILGNMSDGGTSCHWCIKQHKAKAIKEFAERLKAEITTGVGVLRVSTIDIIDDLVKEMTEDNG